MAKNYEQFKDFKLNKQLLDAISDAGLNTPTPIQKKAIPQISAGHDVIGIAQTGTGKTAAYLLPLLMKVKFARHDAARALILSPTRELTVQIADEVVKFAYYTDIRTTALYGGVGAQAQIEQLNMGTDIIVATPGRFLDLYRRQVLPTKFIKTLILDEADKMMDMGFMPQIITILEKIPMKRQNLLFSATFPSKVEKLSQEFLHFPVKIEVTPQASVSKQVDQYYFKTPNFKTKINLLTYLLNQPDYKRVIVFVKTKASANNISKFINRKVAKEVRVIHSNKAQQTRLNAIKEFKNGDIRILVTTDVSARGHDIQQVSLVINFDVPMVYEEYVHRIGRTGRAFNKGVAITFANAVEELHLQHIETLIHEKIKEKNLPPTIKTEETEQREKIQIEKELDQVKRRYNPDFQGSFHKKQPIKKSKKKRSKDYRKRGR